MFVSGNIFFGCWLEETIGQSENIDVQVCASGHVT